MNKMSYKIKDMTNEELIKEYPIQDDIWASRKWNKEMTDYVDLSGHEDYTDRVKATDVNYKGQILCKQKGCPNNANEFSSYCNYCYDEKYPDMGNGN